MKAATATAPALLRHLIQSFEYVRPADVDAAFTTALEAVAGEDREAKTHVIAAWVQERAESEMKEWDSQSGGEQILDQDSVYRMYGGTIQSAFMDPSFTLGFCVAYVLLSRERAS